ncbi:hypothetical protein [Microbacterium karelineae]|uniref:hypothetical protein n=1 Tax=Microbacterium karelineae TaxID=2654283 RepID=UPI0012EA78C7|nr:hypothetical protein [Microbacterium karelineae]
MATKKPKGPETKLSAELNTTLGAKVLAEAAKRLDDRPRLLSQVSGFAQKWEQEVFSSEGAVAGKRWKPLAASTSGKALVRTGELLRSLTGAPRLKKASVDLTAPAYAEHLKKGRYAPKSKAGTGRRGEWSGLGGSMPRRNPAPRPPAKRLAILTSELLGMVTPRDYT